MSDYITNPLFGLGYDQEQEPDMDKQTSPTEQIGDLSTPMTTKSKRRPQTTVVRVANMAFQMANNNRLADNIKEGADILIFIEARNRANEPINVARLLGPMWQTSQSLLNGSTAGTAIAVRRPLVSRRTELIPLSDAGSRTSHVQARYQRWNVVDDGERIDDIIGFHNPLRSTGQFPQAESNARKLVNKCRAHEMPRRRFIQAGDCNDNIAQWARAMGFKNYYGAKPMFIGWEGDWGKVTTSKSYSAGSDHAILTLRSVR